MGMPPQVARHDGSEVLELLTEIELEKRLVEARLAKLRIELARAAAREAMAREVTARRELADREVIAALEAELAWHRQPWWRKLLG
jgi:hypothetical protein